MMQHRYQFFLILIVGVSRGGALSTPTASARTWKPKIASLDQRRKLRGQLHDSEKIGTLGFHHVEFYTGDAKSMAYRFSQALGMQITGTTGQHTGNDQCVSYGLQSNGINFLITAPYSRAVSHSKKDAAPLPSSDGRETNVQDAPDPLPNYSREQAHDFFAKHGLAARAVGLEVRDAKIAYEASIAGGARPVLEPTFVSTCPGQTAAGGSTNIGSGCTIAEVELYGDVVLRYVDFPEKSARQSDTSQIPFLPHLAPMGGSTNVSQRQTFGLCRIDHAVGNVPILSEALDYVSGFTGFHEFAEFTTEDVGTLDSGLNSVVLASDAEHVLLPMNEPTEGKRKSQIQTYLEQNEGPGLQHLALKSDDIFKTIEFMRESEESFAGFELMRRPSDEYYRELPSRLGDQLSDDQYQKLEKLGILADADDEGILLQVFTKPIGDRPTFFFEIIQRIGCQYKPKDAEDILERPGCGGFGQGNFRELFKSIEEYEKTLKV